jgi:hypothetical protein
MKFIKGKSRRGRREKPSELLLSHDHSQCIFNRSSHFNFCSSPLHKDLFLIREQPENPVQAVASSCKERERRLVNMLLSVPQSQLWDQEQLRGAFSSTLGRTKSKSGLLTVAI